MPIDHKYFCINRSSSIAATSLSVGVELSVWAMPMRLAAKPWGLAVEGDWSDRRRALVSCHRSLLGSARAWVWSSCRVMWCDRATRVGIVKYFVSGVEI
jgi:hypothetical protein